MIDKAALVRHARDALDNLYDPVHLQVHPLIDILALRRLPSETGGEALRKLLWEAVEALKPPDSAPPHRPEWLSYRLLWLHYIQLLDRETVQRDLALAERTFYRRLQEAVEAVASVLWEGYRLGEPADDRGAAAHRRPGPGALARGGSHPCPSPHRLAAPSQGAGGLWWGRAPQSAQDQHQRQTTRSPSGNTQDMLQLAPRTGPPGVPLASRD